MAILLIGGKLNTLAILQNRLISCLVRESIVRQHLKSGDMI